MEYYCKKYLHVPSRCLAGGERATLGALWRSAAAVLVHCMSYYSTCCYSRPRYPTSFCKVVTMARSVQWLRRILRLLPPSFREEFGEDVYQAWHSELEEIPQDQVCKIWRRIIVDTLSVSPREYAFA